MQKKEYISPELTELGSLSDFTKNGWVGSNSDFCYNSPEDTPIDVIMANFGSIYGS